MSVCMPPSSRFLRVYWRPRGRGLHPAALVRQQENRSAKAAPPHGGGSDLDGVRVGQFLDLQRELLLGTGDPEALAERLVQRLALFLGAAGAAIGVIQDGRYRLLAMY